MAAVVADTHALVWMLTRPDYLSETARAALAEAETVWVSAVSLVELVYLTEKRRLAPDLLPRLRAELRRDGSPLAVVALDQTVADAVADVPRTAVPDMPDRVIAASALSLGVPLVTCDAQITACDVPTVW